MTNQSALIFTPGHSKQPLTCSARAWFLCLVLSVSPMAMANAPAFLPTARASGSSNGVSQQNKDARPLESNKPIERELKGGESHSYQITLAADQYVDVAVEQRGINVQVVLFGPDNKRLSEEDSARSKQGSEVLTFIAELSGNYRLEIRPAEKNVPAGRYQVQIVALRQPSPEERALEDARRASEESRNLRQKGKYDEALLLAERALAIREKVLGPDQPAVAVSLHDLAGLYDNKGDYAKAEPLNVRALAIREKALGPDHPDVAKTLNNLAWIYGVRQDYAKAEAFYRRALGIQEKVFGAEHPEVATTLNDLALLYYEKGDYDQSILINQRVLAIREKTLGPDDSGVAKALNNLALVYVKKGNYAQAKSIYQRALPIWEKALGPDHPEVATVLHNLARVYLETGEYAKAVPLYERALAIREKALGPDHLDVAQSLNNLGMLYDQKGDYAQAEPLHLRALAIQEKKLGPDHPYVAVTLTNLGRIYENFGSYEKAGPLYQRALAVREKALGPNHLDVGASLNNLGQLYLKSKKDDAQAESLFRRSLAVMEKALGSDYAGIAVPLSNLATVYERKGDDDRAEQFYQRALAIREKALGPDHPDVAQSLNSLARLYGKRGDTQKALSFSSRSNEVRERNLNRNLSLGSERQKLSYLKLFAEDTDNALSLHAQSAPTNQEALTLAFTTLLRRKGRALDAMSDDIGVLRSRANPQDQDLFTQLSDARSLLANATLRGPNKNDAVAYQLQLKQIEEKVDKLEGEIGSRSAEFRARSQPITLAAIQSSIPDGATLVEFALYRPNDPRTGAQLPPRYSAYLLSSQGTARWADLGEAVPIDRAVELWRRALRDPERADVLRLGRVVDEKLMQPVRALLGPSKHLLISPDGPLNLIPFAALVDEHNSYLPERYTITYLTSGRDLLRLQVPRESKGPPVIVADPAFGEPALIASRGGASERNNGNANQRAQIDYSQIFFGPLPGVGDEVRALKELLPQATFLTKERATKAAVKLVSGPSVLHIATHGFFLEGNMSADDPSSVKNTRLGKWVAHAENPLLRSGIALAGANRAGSGDDDGILTALEVAGLDLWGTKLVVLSACDTAVGVVKNGDGVYGLRRALVLAGAESQLMSLWPVSDRSTRDLMVGYYKLLTIGEGRGEALRKVQLEMLRSKSHRHPYYWAGFIQTGEWANLEGKR